MNTSLLRHALLGVALTLSMASVGCAATPRDGIRTPEIDSRSARAVVQVEGVGIVRGSDLDCGPGDGDGNDPRERCTTAALKGVVVAKPAHGWRFDHWEIGGVSAFTRYLEIAPGEGPVYLYTAVFAPVGTTNIASE